MLQTSNIKQHSDKAKINLTESRMQTIDAFFIYSCLQYGITYPNSLGTDII